MELATWTMELAAATAAAVAGQSLGSSHEGSSAIIAEGLAVPDPDPD